jgi:hypothetical protein
LHGIGVELRAVHGLRAMDQVVERQIEQCLNFCDAPARRLDGVGKSGYLGVVVHGVPVDLRN